MKKLLTLSLCLVMFLSAVSCSLFVDVKDAKAKQFTSNGMKITLISRLCTKHLMPFG